jgi:polysaccharide deacetylase family protein (PEP-CTERM system associated)
MTEMLHRRWAEGVDAAPVDTGRQAAPSAPDRPLGGDRPISAMTVDVEDYFQVSALAPYVRRDAWDAMPSRVERNTDRVLDLFADCGVRATFFTLAWVAERHPRLIRRIVEGGHELASHGVEHVRVSDQTPAAFKADASRAKAILEDTGGVAVRGYRAASFSIGATTPWAFEVLAEVGHDYSSSVYPIRHDHYGMPDAPRFAYRPLADQAFLEVPISTTMLGGRTVPCGGGGYFRLLPYALSRWALRRVTARERAPLVFYFHPWEIDADQPRVPGAALRARFRHYTNLERMQDKLRAVLRDFRWDRMDRLVDGAKGTAPPVGGRLT